MSVIKRRKTRVIKVGGIKIGGDSPVSVQSMTKTDTRDVKNTLAQIKRLKAHGCEIVRLAVKDLRAAQCIKIIKRKVDIPLVADVHFDYRLAIEAIKNGADKIRINPQNIGEPWKLKAIIKHAKKHKIPIRIGVNSGSLPENIRRKSGMKKITGLVSFARKYIKIFEKENFRDIIISLKSSDVSETAAAYRELACVSDYPFHIGITAAGTHDTGIVKSSIGIGALLLDGIGDTVRVSLTGDPAEEVITAKRILQAIGLRSFEPDIISCPTCGRCQVDLAGLVKRLEDELEGRALRIQPKKPLTIAVMGCEVNGPGEAREADIGIAFGRNAGILFKKGKIVKRVTLKNAVKEILKYLLRP